MKSNPPLPESPLTILELSIDSFQKIQLATVHPNATGIVPVRGKNGAGKSSAIESIMEVLGLHKSEMPITEGQSSGSLSIDLGDLKITKKLTKDSGGKAKRSLTITSKDGAKFSSPASVLEQLRGRTADPQAFLSMSAADQVKTVLDVLGLSDELNRLEGMASTHFDQRRDVGRDAKKALASFESLKEEFDLLDEPQEGLDIESLGNELEEANRNNDTVSGLKSIMEELERFGLDAVKRRGKLQAQVDALLDEIKGLDAEIKSSRSKWTEAQSQSKSISHIDTAPILSKMSECEGVAEYNSKKATLEAAGYQAQFLTDEHLACDEALSGVRAEIAALLDSVEFPIDGMSYDSDDGVLKINGIPLSQASQAERLRTAAAVAMAGKPMIQALFVREGSLFDDDSRAHLEELALERGFQVWFEVVDSNPEGAGLWVEDGEISQ